MNYKNIKIFFLPAILFAVFLGFFGEATAEQFFQQNSTWYQKIPVSPTIMPNSAHYIDDILINDTVLGYGDPGWSIPIFYAAVDTPITTVSIFHEYLPIKEWIISHEWNKVPIPAGALPARNAIKCAGGSADGHMTIISYDHNTAWEFGAGSYCNGQWSAKTVRKWDLTGNGINYPYDLHGATRSANNPQFHGIVTYNEIVNEGKIDHAIAFGYDSETNIPHTAPYISGSYRQGNSSRQWAMLMGERLQLNPSVDCHNLGLPETMDILVCEAMQEYGMIFVENVGAGYNQIYIEDLTNQPGKSWNGIRGYLTNIPLESLRMVQHPCDPEYSPNVCAGADLVPPGAPSGLTVQ